MPALEAPAPSSWVQDLISQVKCGLDSKDPGITLKLAKVDSDDGFIPQLIDHAKSLPLGEFVAMPFNKIPKHLTEAASYMHNMACALTMSILDTVGVERGVVTPYLEMNFDEGSSGKSHPTTRTGFLFSNATESDPHIDRGLFNLVFGTKKALSSLYFHEKRGHDEDCWVSAVFKFPPRAWDEDGNDDDLYCFLLAGMTLCILEQHIFPGYAPLLDDASLDDRNIIYAPWHCARLDDAQKRSERAVFIFQWRLSDNMPLSDGLKLYLYTSEDAMPSVRKTEPSESSLSASAPPPPTLLPEGNNHITIHVKTLPGKTAKLVVDPTWTVQDIKAAVQEEEGTPPQHQILAFNGIALQDHFYIGRTYPGYCIPDGSIMHLVMNLMGD